MPTEGGEEEFLAFQFVKNACHIDDRNVEVLDPSYDLTSFLLLSFDIGRETFPTIIDVEKNAGPDRVGAITGQMREVDENEFAAPFLNIGSGL